jgi:Tol biopolymer transport system component
MNKRLLSGGGIIVSLIALLATLVQGTGALAQAQQFAHPAFQRTWTRTDQLVQQGQAGRSWYWGPQPRTATQEQWIEGTNGQRLVQYFDKSRMEINDPNSDQNNPFYVTNGLLTVELISGNMQIGTSAYLPRNPACINISGDSDDATAPTYFSFRSVATVAPGLGKVEEIALGKPAVATINRAGDVGVDNSKSNIPGVNYAYYEGTTKHNIPAAFWNFLNAVGPVIENGQQVNRPLSQPWFYASGLPVSDAFWARVKIAGTYQDVLIQAFERRVLTYNPANQPAFQVEMGNIGLHYYDWRYNNIGVCAGVTTPVATAAASQTPAGSVTAGPSATRTAVAATATSTVVAATSTPGATPTVAPLTGKIVFVSTRTGKKDIWIINPDGTTPMNLTAGAGTGDNSDPSFNGTKIAFTSNRDGNPEIYVMNADGSGVTRVTNNPAADTHPTLNPDGSRVAYVSDRNGNQNDIFVQNSDGSGAAGNITLAPGNDHDPNWGSNGLIVFVSNRMGTDDIFTMNPDGTALAQLTSGGGADGLPIWSPTATRILFISDRDGNHEVYVMKFDGNGQLRVTTLLSEEFDAAWAPNESFIVYTSNRGGNYDLYMSYLSGANLRQLTTDAAPDTQPSWH